MWEKLFPLELQCFTVLDLPHGWLAFYHFVNYKPAAIVSAVICFFFAK